MQNRPKPSLMFHWTDEVLHSDTENDDQTIKNVTSNPCCFIWPLSHHLSNGKQLGTFQIFRNLKTATIPKAWFVLDLYLLPKRWDVNDSTSAQLTLNITRNFSFPLQKGSGVVSPGAWPHLEWAESKHQNTNRVCYISLPLNTRKITGSSC